MKTKIINLLDKILPELDETKKKERLFEMLPGFVKEYFSTTWLEKLSSEEIEELLTIP